MTGRALPAERRSYTERPTGARVTRWTAAPAMHHHLYFTTGSWPAAGGWFCFCSYRDGYPNFYSCRQADGGLVQLTDRDDLNPYSAALSPGGDALYATARDVVWRFALSSGEASPIARFPGARLGNCSLDAAGRRLALGCRYADRCELALIDTNGAGHDVLCSAPEVGHVQFCPADADLLLFSGLPHQRIWLIRADGTGPRPLYAQRHDEWLVHESWLGAEVIVSRWPRDLLAVEPATGEARVLADFPAWHACAAPDGRRIVCDTTRPARGLWLIDAATGDRRLLCDPHASCRGRQWATAEPAAGAGIDTSILRGEDPGADPPPTPSVPEGVYGPQWTHPHPSFGPDGAQVIYTSDNGGGWSHVYTVEL